MVSKSEQKANLVNRPYLVNMLTRVLSWSKIDKNVLTLQVNLFQKHLFLHQLTHNMTKYCSLIYQFSTWKLQAHNMLGTQILFLFLFWHSEQFMYTTCSELVVFMYWTGKSMNNLLSYCGLVDPRISASDKDLPVRVVNLKFFCLIFRTILGLQHVQKQSHSHIMA